MLMSYDRLLKLLDQGVIQGSDPSRVNSSSIDVTLGSIFLVERPCERERRPWRASLRDRDALVFDRVELKGGDALVLDPGQFVLAQTREMFNLPTHISAEFKMRSTAARMGLEQLGADWCGAGWQNSVLTLELKNLTQHHRIELLPGDAIGQMVFYSHAPVPKAKAYKGAYNGDVEVSTAKGAS